MTATLSSSELSQFGHHFIIGISGSNLSSKEKEALSELCPLGVLIRKDNFNLLADQEQMLTQYAELLEDTLKASGREKLLVCSSFELYLSNQFPFLTELPLPKYWGKHYSGVAKCIADELGSIGINFLLGPDAAVYAANAKTASRFALAHDVDSVTEAICILSLALQKEGLIPCPGNFPGEGAFKMQPGQERQSISLIKEELTNRDLRPFAALADLDLPALSASALFYTGIDPDYPAFMSAHLLKLILRDKLGYDSTLISPDLTRAPSINHFTQAEIAKNTLAAGTDVLLVSDLDNALEQASYLRDAAQLGLLGEEQLLHSATRIDRLYEALSVPSVKQLSADKMEEHHALAAELKNYA